MDDMVYLVVRAQALMALGEMLQEASWAEPGPGARFRIRLRATIGKRLIQMGTLLVGPSGAEPRKQTQTA